MLDSRMRAAALVLSALAATGVSAADLVLPPGGSVVVLDAGDPAARLVITAPANAPLDITPLLALKPDENIYSIVTRLQSHPAGGMMLNDDGSVSLSAAGTPSRRAPTAGLAGGVLIRQGGAWTLRAAAPPAASAQAAPAQPPPSGRATIYKPGVTREQAERDIADCRVIAEPAAAQQIRPADRVQTYNQTMYACIRALGYEIRM